jgi:hypothetical protein
MRLLALILTPWLIAVQAAAPVAVFIRGPLVASPSYLLRQNFEGTGYDNGETWTETLNSGTVDEDYTTTVLSGSESLLLTDAAFSLCTDASPTWASQTVTYGYFQYRQASIPAAAGAMMFIRSAANTRVSLEELNNGRLRFYGNVGGTGTAASPVTPISNNTLWHIWWSVDFTASPETITIALSTDGVRPTSGDGFATSASDITAGGVNALTVTPTRNSIDTIFDRILVDDVQIGDNP